MHCLLLLAQTREVTSLASPGYKWLGKEHISGVSDTKPFLYSEPCGPKPSQPVRRAIWAKGLA